MPNQDYDPRYLQFFECFNQQLFFEAHEVLEGLWRAAPQGFNGPFYKGLIQLAGAFVHLQKNRPSPAAKLFELARDNLRNYPATHEGFAVTSALVLIEDWLAKLGSPSGTSNPSTGDAAPHPRLPPPVQGSDLKP